MVSDKEKSEDQVKSFRDFIRNDRTKVATVDGLCIIALAVAAKKLLHIELSIIETAFPGYLLVVYEAVRAKTSRAWLKRPLWWNLAAIVATVLIVLRRYLMS